MKLFNKKIYDEDFKIKKAGDPDYINHFTERTKQLENLIESFYRTIIHTKLRIDISNFPMSMVDTTVKVMNIKLSTKLTLVFPNCNEAIIYKSNHQEVSCYQPESHLYKLGESYPYKPIPPKTTTTICNTAIGTNNEFIINYEEEAKKKYHLHFIYRNNESHNIPTPPWYKQEIDICKYLQVILCNYINPIIIADELDIFISYRDNQFFIDIYTPEITESVKNKIDDTISFPVISIHGWGELNLVKTEIKEYK